MRHSLGFGSIMWSLWWRKQLHDFVVAFIKSTGHGCGFMLGLWIVAHLLGLKW